MGINRTRRWKRANSLGLNPPIEVLAVLIKEEDINNAKVQKPYIEVLMVSTFTE
jgi:DNA polymerase delta subunit 4